MSYLCSFHCSFAGPAAASHPQSHLVGHFSSASTSSLTGLGLNSGGCGSGSETTSTTTNLIVNSLPQDMTERELYSLFVTMGPIESCRVMRDLKTGYSYGFGFVNFISDESALRAIKCLNGLTIRNKRIKVRCLFINGHTRHSMYIVEDLTLI